MRESIRHNVNLRDIDIAVIDYGLSKAQRFYLEQTGQTVIKGRSKGNIVVARFQDMLQFLRKSHYQHILMCDGGDIIVQTDISSLFRISQTEFKAVCEDANPAFDIYLTTKAFGKRNKENIERVISGKPMINAGVIVAPRKKMISRCRACMSMIKDPSKWGADQIVVNYVLYKDGFVELPIGYNFVIATARKKFSIKNGIFYFEDGRKIPIVHNAGRHSLLRPIKEFGFGRNRNVLKKEVHFTVQKFSESADMLTEAAHRIKNVQREISDLMKRRTRGRKGLRWLQP